MLKNLTIDRSKWLIPETSEHDSCLLAEDGKMCCLGQYAFRSGIKKKKLFAVASPCGLVALHPRKKEFTSIFEGLVSGPFEHTHVADTLMYINDTAIGDSYVRLYKNGVEREFKLKSQKQRERLIAKEFARIGIKVTFVGDLDLLQHAKK